MLYRRVSQHIKDQNWVAIAIDFLIVVSGVLLGLQAQQWIENRDGRENYHLALERLETEMSANLQGLKVVEDEHRKRMKSVTESLSVLQSCSDDNQASEKVNAGLLRLIGTMGLSLRTSALEDLTANEALLRYQSPKERQNLKNLLFTLNHTLREASFVETLPLEERFQDNPIISIGEAEMSERTYVGKTWTSVRRELFLNVPVSQACQNNELIKSFYYWERWQGELFAITALATSEIDPVMDWLRAQ